MATLNASFPTLYDLAKARNPDGSIAKVVEILEQRNPLLKTMHWMEGNLPTGHQFTYRSGLPAVSWVYMNQGIVPVKGRTSQMTDTCGILNTRSAIDYKLATLNGNSAAWRAAQEAPFLDALQNELETGMFYHDTSSTPEKILGLAPRFSATTSVFGGSQVVLSASADGNDNTSIWLICWGPDTVSGIVPKGSTAGFEMVDLGKQLLADGSGTTNQTFLAYATEWFWRAGLSVMDPRAIARVANIDTEDLIATGATGPNLINSMIQAYHKLYQPQRGRCAWYCNRTVGTYLHLQAKSGVANSTLTIDEIAGRPITSILGIPVYETDAITITEAALS